MKRLTSNIEGLSARQLAQRCIGAEELSNGRERKLALGDDILMSVSSPARYVGGEVNSVMKTLTPGMVRFAMCFPDVYEIGMSHLGIQILYDMFNRYDDVWCERVYSPWLDLDKIMREKKIPLFALESQEPVKNFDFLGITLQYEMCYTNVLQVLDLSGIPLLAKDRTEEDPIVIGGGPCSYNPEPIAEFFDLFYIGEGETAYRKLLDVYKEVKEKGGSRQEFLLRAAREVPGMYVPSLYEVSYKEDGTIASFVPTKEGVPAKITKEIVMDLDNAPYPEKPVVPFIRATQDRVVLEIQRGCIRGCRFCQAGQLYRPVREKSLETLKHYATTMLDSTGQEEISLSSLSSSDYSHLEELVDFLMTTCQEKKVNISLPSLRIDAFSLDVMGKVQDVKKSSLTFAPEAGSQRLRNVINKGLTEEVILKGAGLAFEGGWSRVKLYFMLGLPTETDEDVLGIADLANKVYHVWRNNTPNRSRGVRITVSTSCFVPKSHTPFQWEGQNTQEEYLRKVTLLRENLRNKSITYNWHDPETSFLEAVLSRGDRRIADVIEEAWRHGAKFDSWSEYFSLQTWMDAFAACGVDPTFYANRLRDREEVFPWTVISDGVTEKFLWREREQAYAGKITPDCREKCSGCGANRLCEGGICHA